MKVKLYIEGGGDSKEQHVRCREGFRKLFEKAGLTGRMPATVAGGGRGKTFDLFQHAVAQAGNDNLPILLVDSEDPIEVPESSSIEWAHLKERDGWDRPRGATDDQAQLMVTCMETWIMTDRIALAEFFGSKLREGSLLPLENLETRSRVRVLQSLTQATKNCANAYQKGERSFQVLAFLEPETLKQHLPYFQRLIDTLERYC